MTTGKRDTRPITDVSYGGGILEVILGNVLIQRRFYFKTLRTYGRFKVCTVKSKLDMPVQILGVPMPNGAAL